jgi:hypothetical protein
MTTTAPTRRLSGGRRVVAATLLVCLATALLAACSHGDPSSGDSPSPAPSSTPEPLATTVKLGVVTGRLGTAERDRAVSKVTALVDEWIDAAYVGGEYPRDSFDDAFAAFSPGAGKQALDDARLMSNADIGPRVESVTAKVRRVAVDLLGTRGIARAATARVRLVFVTDGTASRRVTVTGSLRLVREDRVWRVFGYDVAKGFRARTVEPSAGAAS